MSSIISHWFIEHDFCNKKNFPIFTVLVVKLSKYPYGSKAVFLNKKLVIRCPVPKTYTQVKTQKNKKT